ncbi:MAG: class II aldolase/adducin family protein [Thiolinea sp.]
MDFALLHPREQLANILARIYTGGMTTTSGGNLSIRDEAGNIWITPKGVDKGALGPADMVCVRADGGMDGIHPPSSEYPFHLAIYRQRPDLQAIIHGHPAALVAFSIVRQTPRTEMIPQARQVCGEVGYAPYAVPGTDALGDSIAATFAQGVNAVIMENHGTVVGGASLLDAFQRFESLEFCARTQINASRLGSPRYLSDQQFASAEHQQHLLPLLEQVEHPADERELRQTLCRFVQRACQQGLMISTYGTISARWQGDDFIITPTSVDRRHLQASDLVQIRNGQREPGRLPSRSVLAHAEIYRRHPHVNSVVVTQPPNIMAFAVSGADFETAPSRKATCCSRMCRYCRMAAIFQGGHQRHLVHRHADPADRK